MSEKKTIITFRGKIRGFDPSELFFRNRVESTKSKLTKGKNQTIKSTSSGGTSKGKLPTF